MFLNGAWWCEGCCPLRWCDLHESSIRLHHRIFHLPTIDQVLFLSIHHYFTILFLPLPINHHPTPPHSFLNTPLLLYYFTPFSPLHSSLLIFLSLLQPSLTTQLFIITFFFHHSLVPHHSILPSSPHLSITTSLDTISFSPLRSFHHHLTRYRSLLTTPSLPLHLPPPQRPCLVNDRSCFRSLGVDCCS